MSFSFILLLATAAIFGFLNGFHDSSNIVAAPIASRSMKPRTLLWLAAAAHLVGPFLFGVAVAKTIGEGLADPAHLTLPVVIAAVQAAVIWNIITWLWSIPSSSSHALVGGLVGAVASSSRFTAIHSEGLIKVVVALFISPVLGLVASYLLMNLTRFLARGATPRINRFFKRAQVLTTVALALSHSANDAQIVMGVITLGLVVEGTIASFIVPTWVVALSAGMLALGTAAGGWRLIKTLGGRIYKIRPVDGFVSQIAGAGIILGAAVFGGPVSTTQVMSSAIMGAGAAHRVSKVRWRVGYEMLIAWALTIPISAALAALLYFPLNWLLG